MTSLFKILMLNFVNDLNTLLVMKKSLLFLLIPFIGFSQINLSLLDNFEDYTTHNWTKGDSRLLNENVFDGGPLGEGDNFMRVRSNEAAGYPADRTMLTFNNAQWTGNFVEAGVTYISMDVRNSGENLILLRLAFETAPSEGEGWFSSTNPIAVVQGQGWNTIVFPINSESMIQLGPYSYNEVMAYVSEMRILHNDAPAYEGDEITAVLDIDNIQARDENLNVISFENLKENVQIAPNPAKDFVNVSGLKKEEPFKIYNSNGQIVKSGTVNNNKNIAVQNLEKGFYIIQIGDTKTKFIKE